MLRYLVPVLILGMGFCGCEKDEGERKRIVYAANILRNMAKMVVLAEDSSGGHAPTSLPELVDWMALHVSKEVAYIDYARKSVKDPWGNEVILVSRDGKLLAIGSAGPDRKWESGKGDDILVKIEEFKPK